MGRTDSQKGQQLTLRCPDCKRVLRIYYQKKTVSSIPKLVVISGSVQPTEKETTRIHVRCKCGNKVVFENQSSEVTKYGWRCIK